MNVPKKAGDDVRGLGEPLESFTNFFVKIGKHDLGSRTPLSFIGSENEHFFGTPCTFQRYANPQVITGIYPFETLYT